MTVDGDFPIGVGPWNDLLGVDKLGWRILLSRDIASVPVQPKGYARILMSRYFPTNVGNISDAQQYQLEETSPSSKLRE